MLLRTHLSSVAALAFILLGMAGLAHAGPQPAMANWNNPSSASQAPLILAQMNDPRVAGLEEEVRRLNGKLEELNFLILQMQDQLRRMQEDNEFRFQELEGGAQSGEDKRSEAPNASENSTSVAGVDPQQPKPGTGQPPRTLGNITFDENGNLLTAAPSEEPAPNQLTPSDNTNVAALPSSGNPEEVYRNAYEFLMAGDYRTAEAGFRDYLNKFPEGEQAADASFWLGDSVLQQGKNQEAAEIFLKANKDFPDAPKAPEMLLKLGVTLGAMKQRAIACATFDEVNTRYPQLSNVLKERVKRERASAGC